MLGFLTFFLCPFPKSSSPESKIEGMGTGKTKAARRVVAAQEPTEPTAFLG